MDPQKNILILDGNDQSSRLILQSLGESVPNYKVEFAPDIAGGLNYLENGQPDVVLVDEGFTSSSEFDTVKTRLNKENIPYILLSEVNGKEVIERAERAGASEYLVKNKFTAADLAKTIQHALKLTETEARLNRIFEEYANRIESFSLILEAVSEGAVIIDSHSSLQYSNNAANLMLNDNSLGPVLMSHLTYRSLPGEQVIEVKDAEPGYHTTIKLNNFFWNGEPANLFIVEKTKVTGETHPSHSTIFKVLAATLNAVDRNILLFKNDKIELVNNQAEKFIISHGGGLTRKNLEEIFLDPALGESPDTLVTSNKILSAHIHFPGASAIAVDFQIRNLNLGNEFYQLLMFQKSSEAIVHAEQLPGRETSVPDLQHTNVSPGLLGPIDHLLNEVQLFANSLHLGRYERAAEHATSSEKAMKKLKSLIKDFQEYAALSNRAISPSKISMKTLVDETLEKQKGQIEHADAEINISDLPEITADKELVERLLLELISNAIKFRRKNKKPVIDIGHDFFEGTAIFCIRDNGMGISRKDHEKIFEPFVTLDNEGEHNRGLGLAICRKIVELHGGRIWVESLPGHGSNFYFTLS